MARAYHTVSDIALSVVAGLPLDLMATERAESYREGMVIEKRMTFTRDSVETDGPGKPGKSGRADGI